MFSFLTGHELWPTLPKIYFSRWLPLAARTEGVWGTILWLASVCLMRGFATNQIARGEISQFPSLVSPPLKCRSPRILADGFSDPLNCRFTFSILGFMLRFSYPLFVFQLAIRSGRRLFRSEIVVSVAPSLYAEDTEPLSSRAALFVRVNLNSERNHIRTNRPQTGNFCTGSNRFLSLHRSMYGATAPFWLWSPSKGASILLCPYLISSNLKDL
jgi:hypothetical protein